MDNTTQALNKAREALEEITSLSPDDSTTDWNHALKLCGDALSTITAASAEEQPSQEQPSAPVAQEALEKRIAELEAARMAYASEFPPNADGEPDVGNIHANIRKLKAERHVLTEAELSMVKEWLDTLAANQLAGKADYALFDKLRALSTATQVEAKEVQTQDAAINDFVEGYEMDSGEGIYTPTEHERFLINDAIRTFLADQDWYMTAAPASQKEGEQ